MSRIIAVIGGRHEHPELLEHAEAVGQGIAEQGAILLCGGLTGIMEASAKGARQAKGITIGMLPGDSKDDANAYIDIPIPTGLGLARNAIISRAADGVIAIGGSYGTLSEIAYALHFNKPVIGLNTWDIEGVIKVENADDAVKKLFKMINP